MPNHRGSKILFGWVLLRPSIGEPEAASGNRWDGGFAAGVRIDYSDGLVLISEVLNDGLGEDVEWSSKEYVVGQVA